VTRWTLWQMVMASRCQGLKTNWRPQRQRQLRKVLRRLQLGLCCQRETNACSSTATADWKPSHRAPAVDLVDAHVAVVKPPMAVVAPPAPKPDFDLKQEYYQADLDAGAAAQCNGFRLYAGGAPEISYNQVLCT
jgi:hypothetical protein